ncbi:MAG: hypothetical protein AMXMBFR60_19400 [Chloroflexota bacterium]
MSRIEYFMGEGFGGFGCFAGRKRIAKGMQTALTSLSQFEEERGILHKPKNDLENLRIIPDISNASSPSSGAG